MAANASWLWVFDPRLIAAVCLPGRDVSVTLPESYEDLADWPLAKRLTLVRAVTELAANMAKHSSGDGQLALIIDPPVDADDSPAQVHLMTANRAEGETVERIKRADACLPCGRAYGVEPGVCAGAAEFRLRADGRNRGRHRDVDLAS